jgi:2-haloacid dehalogenase
MAQRPRVIVFDVIETLFSLEPLGQRLAEVGLAPELVRLWFSRLLRDAFALEIAGLWRPFRDVASATLTVLAKENGRELDEQERQRVLSALAELPPQSDARAALETARDAGVPCACLSNGAAVTTSALLGRAGLGDLIARVISADEIQHWKPLWDVYLHAADVLGQTPNELALVSAHAWDIEGARQAGLTTAWIMRQEPMFSPLVAPPDISAIDLSEAVTQLLALPRLPDLITRPPSETLH